MLETRSLVLMTLQTQRLKFTGYTYALVQRSRSVLNFDYVKASERLFSKACLFWPLYTRDYSSSHKIPRKVIVEDQFIKHKHKLRIHVIPKQSTLEYSTTIHLPQRIHFPPPSVTMQLRVINTPL